VDRGSRPLMTWLFVQHPRHDEVRTIPVPAVRVRLGKARFVSMTTASAADRCRARFRSSVRESDYRCDGGDNESDQDEKNDPSRNAANGTDRRASARIHLQRELGRGSRPR